MKTVKILLTTSVSGKNENGIRFSWANGDEVDCETDFANRLIEKGYATLLAAKVEAKPKATRKKSVKVASK